jgi:hypothetical protein
MLKPNSKKLLLWLYPAKILEEDQPRRRRVPYRQVQLILPDLTEAGRQSLIRLLENKQLLFSDELGNDLHLTLSSHGITQLEAYFPALKMQREGWEGNWSMLLFLKSPAADKSFRYLRSLLLDYHCFALKRGVYLRAGSLPDPVNQILQKTYRQAVVVIEFNQWQFGDEQIVIGQKTNLQAMVDVYSGIGTELKSLLTNFVQFKSLTDQQKLQFNSVFDRLYSALEDDYGLIPNYFPKLSGGVELLSQLQQGVAGLE